MDRVKAPTTLRIRAERILRKPAKSVYRIAGNVLEVELSDGTVKYVDVVTKKEVNQVVVSATAKANDPAGGKARIKEFRTREDDVKTVVNAETEEVKTVKPRAKRKAVTKEKSTKKKK